MASASSGCGYTGLSAPVIGLGITLQYVSIPVALLIFSAAVALALLAATPTLMRVPGYGAAG